MGQQLDLLSFCDSLGTAFWKVRMGLDYEVLDAGYEHLDLTDYSFVNLRGARGKVGTA